MSELIQRNPFSIEQAGNFLKELGKKLVQRIKKARAEDAKISTALPEDRKRFLSYGISLLEDVSRENMYLFCKVTGKSLNLYSSTELAQMFRQILLLRINGVSMIRIAFILKTPPDVLKKVELIAMGAVNEAIEKAKVGKIPILNG